MPNNEKKLNNNVVSDGAGVVTFKSGNIVSKASSITQAQEELESGFGSWDLGGQLLYIGHACWLLKEVCWILLLSYPAFFFGAVALVAVLVSIALRWDGGTSAKLYREVPVEILISIMHLGWLFWNCWAMVLSFAYDVPEENPGYADDLIQLASCGRLSGGCKDTYDALTTVNRIGFILVFALWIGALGYLLYLWLKPPRFVAQGFAFQTCLLEGGWIAFWVMKDFCWSYDEDGFVAAAVAWAIHFVLLVIALSSASAKVILWDGLTPEEMERIGDMFCRLDLVFLSYIMWSLSSIVWLLMEEEFDEDDGWRYVAAIMCAVAFVLFIAGFTQARQKGQAVSLMSSSEARDRVLEVKDKEAANQEPESQKLGTPVEEW